MPELGGETIRPEASPASSGMRLPRGVDAPSWDLDATPRRQDERAGSSTEAAAPSRWKSAAFLASVTLLTASMLGFEVLQTITLSLQIFSHNAFLVVSVSMLGLGGGGTLAMLVRRLRPELDARRAMQRCALAFALSVALVMLPASRSTDLVALIFFLVIPYVFAGVFLALLFEASPRDATRSYFFDLIGSALGCLLLAGAITQLGDASKVVLLVVAGGALAAALAASASSRGPSRIRLPLAVAAFALLLLPFADRLYPFVANPQKPLSKELVTPGAVAKIVWSKWNFIGRLDAVDFEPGDGTAPPWLRDRFDHGWSTRILYTNGGANTMAIGFNGDDAGRREFVRSSLQSMGYWVVGPRPDVLNIGLGAGIDVALAIENGARRVTGVEINPLMIEAIGSHSRSFWGIDPYNHPLVTLKKMDGRTFVNSTEERFDLITLTAVDSYAGVPTSSYVLSENYLYTEEAFDQYLERLNPGGALYVRRPSLQMTRLLATAIGALERRGVEDPAGRIVLVAGRAGFKEDFESALIFRDAPSDSRLATIRAHLGTTSSSERLAWLAGPPASFLNGRFLEQVHASGLDAAYQVRKGIVTTPVSDDRPFFYHTAPVFFGSPAAGPLVRALVTTTIVALILIVAPLGFVPLRDVEPRIAWHLVYFMAIGVGFMFTEVVLVQKLGMFLGHPAYSLAVSLFGILLFSGLGSIASGWIRERTASALTIVFPLVVVAIVAYAVGLTDLLMELRLESMTSRIAVALLLLAPGSFLMGMPFPLKIGELSGRSAAVVPWAWAINSFFSVLASILATMLAINFGFDSVLTLAAAAYLLALLAHVRMAGRSTQIA